MMRRDKEGGESVGSEGGREQVERQEGKSGEEEMW